MRVIKNFIHLLLLLLNGVSLCAAEIPQFKTPSVRLPNSEIKAIFRSSDGFLWLGTGIGLVRYDGYEAVSFPSPVTEQVKSPNAYVDYITEYPKGTLWVRTSSGMSVFDIQKEQYFQSQSEYLSRLGINSIPWYVFADSYQRLWVAFHGGYLACRDSLGNVTDITPTLQGNGIGREVTAIRETSEGIVIAYNDGNLVCMDAATTRQRWHTVVEQPVQGEMLLFADAEGLIWLYSYKWIKYFNPKEQTWGHRIDFDSKNYNGIHAICQDLNGHVWVGRERGLEIYDENDELMYKLLHSDHDERSIPYNTITALLADDNGTIWVGGQRNGIAYYHQSIYKSDFLPSDDVTTIVSASDGQIWLGSNSNGLIRWNPLTGEQQRFGTSAGLPSNTIVKLLQASDGRLWIGTYLGGLSCYDGRTFRNYGVTQNGLANANIWALTEDREGNIWIGTLGGGVQMLNPQTGEFTTYNQQSTSFPIDVIASLCTARDGSIYVATMSTGIYVKRRGEPLKPFGKAAQIDQFIYQIHEDSQGRLWMATHNGLFRYDPQADSVSTIPLISHTPTPIVYGVAEDAEGNIWTMTDCEVFRIDRKGNQQVFNENDGLKIGSFNSNAIHITTEGSVMTGSLFGVNIIRLTNNARHTVPPHVFFTRLDIQGRRVQVGEEVDGRCILEQSLNSLRSLTLSHDQAAFTVYFASDDMLLPAKTRFRYRLEGIDHDYYECTPGVHWATYTSLPSGRYTLHVVAVGSNGNKGEEALLSIRILPPWWLSVWAWMAYALMGMGVLAAAYLYVMRREQHKFQIQQLEDDAHKTDELNQMKFRFFTNISHELRTPLTLILSPLENVIRETDNERQKSQLTVVQKNANRLLMLVNQLLDFRKMDMAGMKLNLAQGNIVEFIKSICDSFTNLTDRQGVQLTFFSAIPSLEMAFDEDKLSKIMFNLLSNAFKFTPDNGRVDVAIERSKNNPKELTIRVADTGVGISDADKKRIFDRFYQVSNTADTRHAAGSGIGLSLVKDFVEMHGGTICVVDNIGSGSVFIIQLPIKTLLQPLPQSEEQGVESATLPHSEEQGGKSATVLIVDDNEEMVSFMRDTFTLYFNVRTAANGQQAWGIIQATPPDIIVSDMMMPVMDGNELCRLVKGNAATRNIPFVMLTARHADESRVESLKLGADDYVTKPFNTEVLLLRLRKLLELAHRQHRGQINPEVEDIEITPVDEKLVADAIKYVEQNMGNDELSVEELSRALAMSRTNLYKKLLTITGKTPIEFIRIIRLKRAAQYLRDSGLSIAEVAYRVGFNPRVFSRHFKDEFGCLPSEYREKGNQ